MKFRFSVSNRLVDVGVDIKQCGQNIVDEKYGLREILPELARECVAKKYKGG